MTRDIAWARMARPCRRACRWRQAWRATFGAETAGAAEPRSIATHFCFGRWAAATARAASMAGHDHAPGIAPNLDRAQHLELLHVDHRDVVGGAVGGE